MAGQVLNRGCMKLGMLAEVQAVQMESEGFNLDEKRIDQRLRDPGACVLHQAFTYQSQITKELFRLGIAALPARLLQRALDPLFDIEKKETIALSLRIRERIAKDRGKGFSVFLQCGLEFHGNWRHAGRRADQPSYLP